MRSLISAIRRRQQRSEPSPILVAIDGPSGSGKTTVAGLLLRELDAVVVPSDDFFAADITSDGWQSRSPEARAADALDWRRLRREALEPLLGGTPASWHPFDFEGGIRPDGSYGIAERLEIRGPAPLIILEGAYCS